MFPISTLCMLLLSAARPHTVGVSFFIVLLSMSWTNVFGERRTIIIIIVSIEIIVKQSLK